MPKSHMRKGGFSRSVREMYPPTRPNTRTNRVPAMLEGLDQRHEGGVDRDDLALLEGTVVISTRVVRPRLPEIAQLHVPRDRSLVAQSRDTIAAGLHDPAHVLGPMAAIEGREGLREVPGREVLLEHAPESATFLRRTGVAKLVGIRHHRSPLGLVHDQPESDGRGRCLGTGHVLGSGPVLAAGVVQGR